MKRFLFVFGLFGLFFEVGVAGSVRDFLDYEEIPEFARFGVEKLVERGVLGGNSDGAFRPDRALNRAEFSKMLVEATGVDRYIPLSTSFPDVEDYDWFFPYVETAKHYGWIDGYPDGSFRPGGKINRAEIAKILVNAFGFEVRGKRFGEDWFDPYVGVLLSEKLLPHGVEGDFLPSKNSSRAEISEQLFRFMKKTGKFSSFDLEEKLEKEDPLLGFNGGGEERYVQDSKPFASGLTNGEGELHIEKWSNSHRKIAVDPDQQDVEALVLIFTAKKAGVRLSGLQFRRIGNGDFSDFSSGWVEVDGEIVSDKISFTQDLITLSFSSDVLFEEEMDKLVVFRVNLSGSGEWGNSSRFVLFLPEWIGADTEAKVGFFPIGGIDLGILDINKD